MNALWEGLAGHLDNPVVLFFVLLALTSAAVSKRFAQIKGPLGSLARWWTSRQVSRVNRNRELWDATHRADRAREKAQNVVDRQRDSAKFEQMDAEILWLSREITDMRRRDRHRDKQARLHAAWDNALIAKLQALGIEVDEPPPLYLDLSPLYLPEDRPSPS